MSNKTYNICIICSKLFYSLSLKNKKSIRAKNRKRCFECYPYKNGTVYSDEELISACREKFSYSQVLLHFNLDNSGGNYKTLKNKINKLNIDISHFTGQGWNKGRKYNSKTTVDDFLIGNVTGDSYSVKLKLFKLQLKEHKCEGCNKERWFNFLTNKEEQIPIDLDHIDGNNGNNKLDNLRILCPNCHRMTPTHGVRNRKFYLSTVNFKNAEKFIKEINTICKNDLEKLLLDKSLKEISKIYNIPYYKILKIKKEYKLETPTRQQINKRTKINFPNKTKIIWPEPEILKRLVWSRPMVEISFELGVSDRMISKKCDKLGIEKPPIGFWLKNHPDRKL